MTHILIINRYDDELSDYKKYINHREAHVSYISLQGKTRLIDPAVSAEVCEVEQLDPNVVYQEATRIHCNRPIDFVIAFSEYDLDTAAKIRTELNIRGAKISDNLLCRNKTSMKEALLGSSVRYPQYRQVASRQEIEAFCLEKARPVILKPQVGAASDGVVKIEKLADIPDLLDFSGYEVEEFIEGEIYHVDAILSGNTIPDPNTRPYSSTMPYFKVSKYINTCLDFRNAMPLGSVTVDDPEFISKVRLFTEEVCHRLHLKDQAIHLEFIKSNEELIFLEVGGRVGGGEIPFITLNNESVDLFEMWFQAALGISLAPVNTKITGFLMMPNPFKTGFAFEPNMTLCHPLITYQNIKQSGEYSSFSYDDIPARVHFMGESQAAVEEAIIHCMETLQRAIHAV
ncbi:ATP-grasp domain-containing protein [Xenorhabdus szentirmaii]|uniref:ATP-grasp domain-containing protein n=1 Tax=Xenorhabdus szentirmaii TaxID=290112 RepID=UPI00198345A3|nr:ATP-grasp domain-containing protein [Xenorhabdus sp. ZM]MBD2806144.1 ATP-grasp domain-containing protein [Xenorhabdus sp. ZM]